MAYQLQTLPQFTPPNAYDQIAKGFKDVQQSQTNKLEQQRMRTENKYLDQQLSAEISALLAATEASQASTNLSKEQLVGTQFQNKLQAEHGEQALLTDMLYKSGIAQSSLANAEVGQINAQIAREKLPTEIANLRFQNDLLKMKLKAWEQYQGGQQGNQGTQGSVDVYPVGTPGAMNDYINQTNNTGQSPLPPLPGAASSTQSIQAVPEKEKGPRDYLPPKVEEMATPYELFVKPEVTTPAQRKAEEEYAGQSARELAKGYSAYANETAEEADKAGKQSVVLQNLRNSYGNTPEKGEILGYLKAITSEAQLYEAFKSNAVMEVLALQKGVQGENDRVMLEKTFGSRTMDEAAMDELLTLTEIANDRLIQKNNELVSWEEGEGRSRSEVERAWQDYIADNSIFDTPKYQAFLKRKWSGMSPKERIKDEERYLKMRDEMLTIEINKAAGE
jgi:hypothetical protein